ncbi:Phosphatidylethanolamine-binding protein 4 [Anas platyrhynchos]|uniref:Phosphatidylethanolamine-binding protein 4 n=1 Tax=Anas platyrhynchos TaxID=8839 RepID=R0JMU4_ANAPL|nr:Phosphatidylethanolamine-binding protein 4 [Anas platyrhynchos]
MRRVQLGGCRRASSPHILILLGGTDLRTGDLKGRVLTDYVRPTPPPRSGYHRYQLRLYEQPDGDGQHIALSPEELLSLGGADGSEEPPKPGRCVATLLQLSRRRAHGLVLVAPSASTNLRREVRRRPARAASRFPAGPLQRASFYLGFLGISRPCSSSQALISSRVLSSEKHLKHQSRLCLGHKLPLPFRATVPAAHRSQSARGEAPQHPKTSSCPRRAFGKAGAWAMESFVERFHLGSPVASTQFLTKHHED